MPCSSKVPYVGFGYPFYGLFSLNISLEVSFSFQRSWGLLFRAFLLFDDRFFFYKRVFPLLYFLRKPFQASCRSSSGLLPSKKPCPLLATERISFSRGRVLSWVFWPFRFLSLALCSTTLFLPVLDALLIFRKQHFHKLCFLDHKGLALSQFGFSLRKGRRPVWPFWPTVISLIFEKWTGCGLFFRLRIPIFLQRCSRSS